MAGVRGTINHKLGRLHYVRETSKEAAHTYRTHYTIDPHEASREGLAGTLPTPQMDIPSDFFDRIWWMKQTGLLIFFRLKRCLCFYPI